VLGERYCNCSTIKIIVLKDFNMRYLMNHLFFVYLIILEVIFTYPNCCIFTCLRYHCQTTLLVSILTKNSRVFLKWLLRNH